MASKRLDAVKLAKSSRWDDLRRLVDSEPATAQQVDSYGMLPLHWACTEPQSISEGVLLALLKAFPTGARLPNTAEMLPLQIAIKAQARIEWLQALLASYPDAVLKKAMTGENAVQLARKAGLSSRSIKLLEEMYHHVCTKEGLPDQLAMEEQEAKQQLVPPLQQEEEEEQDESKQLLLRPSERFQAIASDMPLPQRVSGVQFGQRPRRLSSTASLKLRSFSDNDFYTQRTNAGAGSTAIVGPSPWSPRRTMETVRPQSIVSQRPSVSTRSAVSLPPRWMNAPSCTICAQKFGTFKKRHHCRNCGQSICRDHSARERMKLPHYGLNDRHRVCVVCHDVLRNAGRQLRQQQITTQVAQRVVPLTRTSQAFESDARRSDEAQRSPPNMLERHVSAPARASNSVAVANQGGIDDAVSEQVANLQKQVSQLIEEKQQAEMQLRVQAEMLNDPDRLTNGSRGSNTSGGSGDGIMPISRDRQCSLPMPMHTGSVVPISYKAGQVPSSSTLMYRSSGQPLSRTRSAGCFRPTREIYIDGPHGDNALPPQQARQQPSRSNPMAVNVALQRTTRLQDALNTIAAVESTYDDIDESDTDSDLEGRQTDLDDFHDAEADVDAEVDDIVREYLIDDDGVDYDDDDDDEEAMVEAVKAATIVTNNEIAVEGESESEVGSDTLPEVDVLVSLGHVMMEKGSVSAAVQAFTRAAEIRPDDPALHALLGRAYYADENLDDAVASITKSLSLEPSATNSTLLGKILFEKGDHEMAIAAYQRSLDMQK
uniref:FYVE-type domain-containing protein n=1 Tax=Hyaloperonospora arabidopsidis (strain Emoy2) TaxID=559515 RepID=M4B5Q9_HYAAE